MKRALIFVPEEQRIDDNTARKYFLRRGYKFVALLRNWRFVDEYLRRGEASVVVFGEVRPEIGETTRDMSQLGRAGGWDGAATTRRLNMAEMRWTPERLRHVIDGDSEIPQGLDAESIAAARRIARALHSVTHREERRVY